MTKIATSIRQTIRNSNSFQAVVIGVSGNHASVKISGTGARYSNIEVIGGPVLVGEWVTVDFATDVPKIIAPVKVSTNGVSTKSTSGFSRAKMGASTGGSAGTITTTGIDIVLFNSAGGIKAKYGSDFAQAVLAAVDGDTIFVPNGSFGAGDVSIPAGVNVFGQSRYGSVLTGNFTIHDQCNLETLSMTGTINTSGSVGFSSCDIDTGTLDCLVPEINSTIVAKECYFRGGYGIKAEYGGTSNFTSCYFDCSVFDISSTGGHSTKVSACSYTLWEGDVLSLSGDKAAYDTTNNANLHAADIANGTYTYHLPPPGSMGKVVMSDGSKWIVDDLVPPDLTQQAHAATHGSGGSDSMIEISDTEPSVLFAGKLWVDTGV